MPVFSKNLSKQFCTFVLFMMCAFFASAVRAEMPDAKSRIGTQATITFSDDQGEHTKKSDPVYTVIAQVHKIDVHNMNNKVQAVPGEDVDIAFALTNIGNGVDDVTITATGLPDNVTSLTVYTANGGGQATTETGREISVANNSFILSSMKRRELRNFVVRMRAPAGVHDGDELKIDMLATPSGDATSAQAFSGTAIVGSSYPFIVTPGKAVTLGPDKKTAVAFVVTPGASDVTGYFELTVVKRSDRTPMKFKVGDDVYFDGELVPVGEKRQVSDQLFKMNHKVSANSSGTKMNFNMRIEVPEAVRGEEMLLYVSYAKGEIGSFDPAVGFRLMQSNGLLISYAHTGADFSVQVAGNSSDAAGPDFSIVESATAGATVDYLVKLKNAGSKAETYSFERQLAEGELILSVTAMEANGLDEIRIGASGLPEVGPIKAGGESFFKVRVRLIEARVSAKPQTAKFRIKSLTAKLLPPIDTDLIIKTVIVGAGPKIEFSASADIILPITTYTLIDGNSSGLIFVKIKNPVDTDTASHQYKIATNNNEIAIMPYAGGNCSAAAVNTTGPVGIGGKLFCVVVDMVDKSQLDGVVTFTDITTSATTDAAIRFIKPGAVLFASDNYSASGTPGVTSDVTVEMINRGGDAAANHYEVWFDNSDAASKTKNWVLKFSLDKKNWQKKLALPSMASGQKVSVFLKIEVPSGVSDLEKWVIRLGIRDSAGAVNISVTTLSLSLDSNDLKVVKNVSILKQTTCDTANLPSDFAASSAKEINDGDCIWYRVTVTNVSTAAAKNMVVRDPLPKHSTYRSGDAKVIADQTAIAALEGNDIVTTATPLGPNEKFVLTYPVQVDFTK